MAVVDPSAEQLIGLAGELMAAKDVIRKQRKVLWCLVAALRASQQQQAELANLVDAILDADS